MKILGGGLRGFELPLARPLATAHGPITSREGELLWLTDDRGHRGFGEATPLPAFGTEDLASARRALDRALETIVGNAFDGPDAALARARALCTAAPCALAAIDSALHDLAAQRVGLSLASWLRAAEGHAGEPRREIAVQALVGGETPEAVVDSASRGHAEGFRTFKLKLAVSPSRRDPGLDLERVAALRSVVGPDARLRLDANEAWDLAEAERALPALAQFGIDYVEQPIGREDLEGLKRLDRSGVVAVAADEALLGSGCEACLELRAASVFVLKPAALGGVGRARTILRRARALGIRVVWSNLIEGAVGRASAIALAAGLGDAEEVHGLGTRSWLSADLASEERAPGGRIRVPDVPGLGCDPTRSAPFAASDPSAIWRGTRSVGTSG